MNNSNKEELKKLVENIVKQLAQKGVNVGGGAILKLKDNGQIESMDGFGSFDPRKIFSETPKQQIPNSMLPPGFIDKVKNMSKEEFEAERSKLKSSLEELVGKLAKKLEESRKPTPVNETSNEEVQEEVSEDENCTCPSCLNYDNFEEKLGKKEGKFDYADVTLGGKLFKIKYHLANSGEENISMRDVSEEINTEKFSLEELQLLLQESVQDRKFDKAQMLLNAIQERKNKN